MHPQNLLFFYGRTGKTGKFFKAPADANGTSFISKGNIIEKISLPTTGQNDRQADSISLFAHDKTRLKLSA